MNAQTERVTQLVELITAAQVSYVEYRSTSNEMAASFHYSQLQTAKRLIATLS